MKAARRLTGAEKRRVDQRGRHFALRIEGDPRYLVFLCSQGHEYAWRDDLHADVNYEFLLSWWGRAKGGVSAPRDACPDCPRDRS